MSPICVFHSTISFGRLLDNSLNKSLACLAVKLDRQHIMPVSPLAAQEKRGQGTDHGHDQRVRILRVVERHGNPLKARFGYLPIV